MKNLLKGKTGFTMVELMVVVIIVGILASVSIPLYRANVKRAIRTEAIATLGSIRSAERVYKSEWDTYANVAALTPSNALSLEGKLGVTIDGPHFFDYRCYAVTAASASGFTATCASDAANAATAATQAQQYFPTGTTVASMDVNGTVTPVTRWQLNPERRPAKQPPFWAEHNPLLFFGVWPERV